MKHFLAKLVLVAVVIDLTACSNTEKTVQADAVETHALEAEQAEAAMVQDTKAQTKHSTKNRAPASVAKLSKSTTPTFIVQVGAFKVRENADRLFAKLKDEGYPVEIQPVQHAKAGELFLVSLMPTQDRNAANNWRSELQQKSGVASQVIVK